MLAAGLPMAVPLEGLPAEVRIHEVGARDGLQNEKSTVPTEVKAEFIHRLAAAGLRTIEATSFVHPRWVPQLADAGDLMPLLAELAGREPDLRLPVLVPNERGLERALALGVREIAVFGSATESFARANLNRTVDESLAMFEPVVAKARAAGVQVRGYLSMCFGDPWEGPVPIAQVAGVARHLHEMGCAELSLGDTIGVATPGHVTALLDELTRHVPVARLAVHFHDTYGQALSNTLAALRRGSRWWTRRPAGSAAVPTPRAPPAISPPRTWCGCSRDSASGPGSTSAASAPQASGWRSTWDGPARPVPSAPLPMRSSSHVYRPPVVR